GERAALSGRGRPALVADPDPPASVLDAAERAGAPLLLLGRDFGYRAHAGQWDFWGPAARRPALAYPALRGQRQLRNAAAALAALDALRERLPASMQDVRRGLAEVVLPGRFQVLPGRPQVILDVAHNVEAAQALAENLGGAGYARTCAASAARAARTPRRWHASCRPPASVPRCSSTAAQPRRSPPHGRR